MNSDLIFLVVFISIYFISVFCILAYAGVLPRTFKQDGVKGYQPKNTSKKVKPSPPKKR